MESGANDCSARVNWEFYERTNERSEASEVNPVLTSAKKTFVQLSIMKLYIAETLHLRHFT